MWIYRQLNHGGVVHVDPSNRVYHFAKGVSVAERTPRLLLEVGFINGWGSSLSIQGLYPPQGLRYFSLCKGFATGGADPSDPVAQKSDSGYQGSDG
jgi:hypothetical protein